MTVFDKNFRECLKECYLTDSEIDLIEFCRELKYGKFTLFVENKQPVRYEQPLMGGKFGKKL